MIIDFVGTTDQTRPPGNKAVPGGSASTAVGPAVFETSSKAGKKPGLVRDMLDNDDNYGSAPPVVAIPDPPPSRGRGDKNTEEEEEEPEEDEQESQDDGEDQDENFTRPPLNNGGG